MFPGFKLSSSSRRSEQAPLRPLLRAVPTSSSGYNTYDSSGRPSRSKHKSKKHRSPVYPASYTAQQPQLIPVIPYIPMYDSSTGSAPYPQYSMNIERIESDSDEYDPYKDSPQIRGPSFQLAGPLLHGCLRIDMSKTSLQEAITGLPRGVMAMYATQPPTGHMQVKCDAFIDAVPVFCTTGVTVGQVLETIHRRLHTPVSEEADPNDRYINESYNPPERGGSRRHFFDQVLCLDLLHGQHHFVGLAEGENEWLILLE